ncbi:MAG: DNA topoisomerase 4 subunit A [Clostridia bacterium]|nr:DNA topoisomerase 4 subunit A [Clostridia bacterium]
MSDFNEKFVSKPLEDVLHDSMIPYSEFVIMDRALPRVEDGLKPVQRRVLYSMLEVGVLPDRPYRKSARIVGDCMGKYHPHGDSSIYGTMVRMAQKFNMGEVLVDGHGNFGSVDGDGAAAMRYTEAKLSPMALEMLRDIEKDTVTWSYNFDDSCKEPDILPSRFPNILVNGGAGIAVGLATNIPTHNLGECCRAVAAYIDNPKISLDELMEIIPGPDFPTGGYIIKSDEIRNAFATGKGKIVMRAKLHIENVENGKKNIVITEIPYQVNKSALLQRIAKVREEDESGVLSGITDIVDETDRSGMRAVLKLKKDAKLNAILQSLYRQTDLQLNFGTNMVAIADAKPKLMSLIDIIDHYVKYQQTIIYNRTKYDLEAALKKEHILEGLLIAIKAIDEVIAIIKKSKNTTEAKITLMQTFTLTDVQAQAILDMRLARLTSLEVERLVTELNRLKDLISRFTNILKSPRMQMNIVKKEILEIAEKYGTPRKTQIIEDDMGAIEEDVAVETSDGEDMMLIYSPQNTIKTVSIKSYNLATKTLSADPELYEIPSIMLRVNTNQSVYAFTNLGNCVRFDIGKLNSAKFKDKGAYITAYCKNLQGDERLVSILELNNATDKDSLVFVTKSGMVKVSSASEYITAKQLVAGIKLKDGDELLYVNHNMTGKNLAIFTKNKLALTFDKKDLPVSGRVTSGVKGITLEPGDYVVSAMQVGEADNYVMLLSNGYAKIVNKSELPVGSRNRKGTIMTSTKNTAKLLKATTLDVNLSYVYEDNSGELKFVENRKLSIDKRLGNGKSVASGDKFKNVYVYQTL